jgi:hypothetical protein
MGLGLLTRAKRLPWMASTLRLWFQLSIAALSWQLPLALMLAIRPCSSSSAARRGA